MGLVVAVVAVVIHVFQQREEGGRERHGPADKSGFHALDIKARTSYVFMYVYMYGSKIEW